MGHLPQIGYKNSYHVPRYDGSRVEAERSLIPSESGTKNKTNPTKKHTLLYKAPGTPIIIGISIQITDKCLTDSRYNLQLIKCTFCIVQDDNVVIVVKFCGPVFGFYRGVSC